MRSLFVCVLVVCFSALLMSVGTKKRSTLTSDQNFVSCVHHIASLNSDFKKMTNAEFRKELETIAASITELKENYPDLSKPSTATSLVNTSIDKIAFGKESAINCDTCLRDFVKAVFNCFSSCGVGPRDAVQACVAQACANYQACKAGQNR